MQKTIAFINGVERADYVITPSVNWHRMMYTIACNPAIDKIQLVGTVFHIVIPARDLLAILSTNPRPQNEEDLWVRIGIDRM